ncbi:SRPBCC family protein [Streptomyces aurantiacus]|uniref:SRPBCC family protein n=1 Tax=Streptomyces aurantiacus TaxID=47760 RepID=UPI003330EE94
MISTRHEITVAAPVEDVWRLHTDIAAWPLWNSGVERAEISGRLEVGVSFRWLTHGLDITSTVAALEEHRSITWGGPTSGIDGMHRWTFAPTADGGTSVVTEEYWTGAPVDADPEGMLALLAQSLIDWLAELKEAAEGRSGT